MTNVLIVGSFILTASLMVTGCSPAAPAPQASPTQASPAPTITATPIAVESVLRLEQDVGSPPSAGWKWAVAESTTAAEELALGPHDHELAWIFFTIRGSAEVSTADGKKMLAGGQGVWIPARQQHSHRYLPQSSILAVHLRPADLPIGNLHGGRTLLVSDKPLEMNAGPTHKLRMHEYTFPPGSRMSENLTSDANFVYLTEGTLTLNVGQGASTVAAGGIVALPLNEKYTVANEGTIPLRLLVVDVR